MNYIQVFQKGRQIRKCGLDDGLKLTSDLKMSDWAANEAKNKQILRQLGIIPISQTTITAPDITETVTSSDFSPGYTKVETPELNLSENDGDSGNDVETPELDLRIMEGTRKPNLKAMGTAADVTRIASNLVTNAVIGGKDFGAQNAAIDAGLDALGEVAGQFGPWGKLGQAMLSMGKDASNLFGQTVADQSVSGLASGYGNTGDIKGQSFKMWQRSKVENMLNRNNAKAQLALRAADISADQQFQQQARTNSISNTIQNNQIALSGGINSSLLAAKKGAKLTKLKQTITRAQYGAKLKKVEVSDEKSLLPEGDLHKNKHDKFDIPVTEKGIPVVHLANGAEVQTLEDLQEHKEHVVQDAEIETNEVIFSKELTDYVEEARKKWHDGDDNILLEVGKRVTKELLHNTMDNTGLIRKLRAEDEGLVH